MESALESDFEFKNALHPVDAADCRRCAGPPHPLELAYEGAGKALELSGAGKELAGAGNRGAFHPGPET